jgi:hypothetical protein
MLQWFFRELFFFNKGAPIMKAYLQFFVGIVLIGSLMITGCSSDSSSPAAVLSTGTSDIEGQLVNAEQSLKAAPQTRSVSPVQGVTVELTQNGVVIATTKTDEYGRFQFSNLDAGQYLLRVITQVVSEYTVVVESGNTLTVYGKVTSTGVVEWEEDSGSHWDEMPEERHWDDSYDDSYDDDSYDDSYDDDSYDDSYDDDSHDDSSYDDSHDDSYDDDSHDDNHDDSHNDDHD